MDNLSIDDRAFDTGTTNSLTPQEFEQLQLIFRIVTGKQIGRAHV